MTNLLGSRHATRWSAFSLAFLISSPALAQVTEDSSKEFIQSMQNRAAAMGLAASGSTLETTESGGTRANVDLTMLKMLVVKKTEHGLVTDHVNSLDEMEAFENSNASTHGVEE